MVSGVPKIAHKFVQNSKDKTQKIAKFENYFAAGDKSNGNQPKIKSKFK